MNEESKVVKGLVRGLNELGDKVGKIWLSSGGFNFDTKDFHPIVSKEGVNFKGFLIEVLSFTSGKIFHLIETHMEQDLDIMNEVIKVLEGLHDLEEKAAGIYLDSYIVDAINGSHIPVISQEDKDFKVAILSVIAQTNREVDPDYLIMNEVINKATADEDLT